MEQTTKTNKEVKINARISEDTYKQFQAYCKENGTTMSKLIRTWIENNIEMWKQDNYVYEEMDKCGFASCDECKEKM